MAVTEAARRTHVVARYAVIDTALLRVMLLPLAPTSAQSGADASAYLSMYSGPPGSEVQVTAVDAALAHLNGVTGLVESVMRGR